MAQLPLSALVATLILSAVIGTASAGPPAMSLFPGSGGSSVESEGEWEGPVLVIYDSEFCDPDIASECPLVTLDCDSGDGLAISIDDLDNSDLGRWLTAERELKLKMGGLIAEGEPRATDIRMNEMNGTWDVRFIAYYSQDPGLRIDVPAATLSFETFHRTVRLRLLGENRAKLEEFVQACQRE